MKRIVFGAMLVFLAASVPAELRIPAVLSDGMVLQRGQSVAVWGWAEPAAEVSVAFGGQVVAATADAEGKFMVRLSGMDASATPRSLTVKAGTESAEVKNVLVGEVWLCSGQSNMSLRMEQSGNFEQEKAAANHPLIRMFLTDMVTSREPQADCSGAWQVCSPETIAKFSAVGYFFGRKLQQELDVPIGLIRSAWGGSPIQAWVPIATYGKYPLMADYKAQQDAAAETFDEAAEAARHARAVEIWNAKVAEAKANPATAPKPPRKIAHPHKSHKYPANCYNGMIHPLAPYTLRGVIWYQGEANTGTIEEAKLYRHLLEDLVLQWRKDWKAELPFYAVQLVNYMAPQATPVEDTGWAFIRESVLAFQKEVPDTGMAVGIDIGEADQIHPLNKQDIGLRLAQQALVKTYGRDGVAGGPIYQSMKREGNKIVVTFSDVGSGLMAKGGEPLKTFAIAGADKRFVWAQAAMVGDTVVVSAAEVPDPLAVRYAWADNPAGCNLFNKEGFPASPFRTDNWDPLPQPSP